MNNRWNLVESAAGRWHFEEAGAAKKKTKERKKRQSRPKKTESTGATNEKRRRDEPAGIPECGTNQWAVKTPSGGGGRFRTEMTEAADLVPLWRPSCCAWCGCGAGRSAGDVAGAVADWPRPASSSRGSRTRPGPTAKTNTNTTRSNSGTKHPDTHNKNPASGFRFESSARGNVEARPTRNGIRRRRK